LALVIKYFTPYGSIDKVSKILLKMQVPISFIFFKLNIKLKVMRILIGLLIVMLAFSCNRPQRENVDFKEWGDYWFQGKAEINSYNLTQYRYGEARDGEAVLIFVTEDFSRKKHVKLDDTEAAGRDKISVLKMNQTREFVTGIYPYHMMLSAFYSYQGGFPRS